MTMTRRLPLIASLLCAAIVLGAADRAPFTFPRSTPEAQGVSSAALLGFIDAAEKQVDALHSFMLVRHGHVAITTALPIPPKLSRRLSISPAASSR